MHTLPANAKVDVHGLHEEREGGTEHGTNEVIFGEDARSVGGIYVCKVVQDRILLKGQSECEPLIGEQNRM